MDMVLARGDCLGSVDAHEATDDAKLVVAQSFLLERSIVGACARGGAGEAGVDSWAQTDPHALLGNNAAAHPGRTRLPM